MRFYLLDRVLSLEKNQSIHAIKCWTQTEEIFNDHFPTLPIVPGVLLIESMSQALGILMEQSYREAFPEEQEDVWSVLSYVQKAKFKKFVIPGDRTEIKASLLKMEKNYGTGRAALHVDGNLKAEAEITLIFFPRRKIASEILLQQRENYVNYLLNSEKINELT